MEQIAGTVKGYVLFGQNPAVGSANSRMQRLGMSKLDWLVVRDFSLIESATWWKDGPRSRRGRCAPRTSPRRCSSFPAASHTEKDGTFTNTQRMVQWHHKAVEPREEQRSDLWFTYHLGNLIRDRLAASTDEMDRPVLDLTWSYPTEGAPRRPQGHRGPGGDQRLGRGRRVPVGLHAAQGRRIDVVRMLDLLRLLCRRRQSDGAAQAGPEQNWTGASGPGHGRPIAEFSTTAPLPTLRASRGQSARRSYGGTPSRGSGRVTTPRTSRRTSRRITAPLTTRVGPDALSGTDPFIMQADGRGWLYAPGGRGRGAAAHPLRAPGLPGAQPHAPPAAQPLAPGLRTREQSLSPRSRRPGRGRRSRSWPPPTGSPSTSPRGACRAGRPTCPSCSRSSSSRCRPSSRPSAGSSTASGRRSSARAAWWRLASWSPTG